MSTGLKANSDGSAAIQVGGSDVITLTSGGAATFLTSPTTVQAGTAAAPSITTSGDTNTGIFFPAADTIAFAEGGTEALRINSSGTVVLSGGNTSANGTGITFPATQSASSNANTLDDYEEGTWTPIDGSGAGLTFIGASGFYTKIGRLVTVVCSFTYPSTSSANAAEIGGLPFACAAAPNESALYFRYTNLPSLTYTFPLIGTEILGYTTSGNTVTNATFSTVRLDLVGMYYV